MPGGLKTVGAEQVKDLTGLTPPGWLLHTKPTHMRNHKGDLNCRAEPAVATHQGSPTPRSGKGHKCKWPRYDLLLRTLGGPSPPHNVGLHNKIIVSSAKSLSVAGRQGGSLDVTLPGKYR